MPSLLIVAATVLSYALGWAVGWPALVPLLNTAASYPLMVLAIRRGDVRLAVARMLVWALALGISATILSFARPGQTGTLFLHGAAYRAEMFTWIMTGVGPESDPARFILQHAWHAVLFVVLALATGGIAAMVMGAALMNYMGHYAGALAASSVQPLLAGVLAWAPWAVARVISFVTLGVVLSIPLLTRTGVGVILRREQVLIAAAVIGLVADVALKWLLAPAWHRLLLRLTGW
jgi:hypothetical protein